MASEIVFESKGEGDGSFFPECKNVVGENLVADDKRLSSFREKDHELEDEEEEDKFEEVLEEEDWNDFQGLKLKSRPERWAPLGAANDAEDKYHYSPTYGQSPTKQFSEEESDPIEMRKMKEDHEQLTSALLALTTHFAQVQFRIQQIVAAPVREKEDLLRDLEEFTFRGIPSAVTVRIGTGSKPPSGPQSPSHNEQMKEKMKLQREKQKDLIHQLKNQLEELESYAYETGEAGLPQSVLLERHKLVVEQLKDKLNLNVDELEKLSDDDLRFQVDQAISDLVSPIKMKEQLVEQLKTQISDLERFIQYLHGEAGGSCSCSCPNPKSKSNKGKPNPKFGTSSQSPKGKSGNQDDSDAFEQSQTHHHHIHDEDELRAKTIQLMKKALTLIQMFAVAQFGCSSNQMHGMNSLKKSQKGNHWGDLRASLEVAIARVYNLALQSDIPADSDYTSDCEDSPSVVCNQAVTAAVRKELAPVLADLLQHGLMHVGQSGSLIPFVNCFPSRSSAGSGFLTAWDLILKYYEIKNGEKYNATPARKLSQSFGLEIVGSTTITNKQLLLSTIDNILTSHSRYKRSPESHFKAFVCAALNCGKLVIWIRLIMRTQGILEQYYQPWSYCAKTGFEDALRSLDKLSAINFDLPIDLAIRQFQNIKDVFQ